MEWPPVSYDQQTTCWWTPVSCADCGGYRHELAVTTPDRERAALLLAQAAHDHHREHGCTACQSRRWRSHSAVPEGHTLLWFDTLARQWMLWLPVAGIPEGVTTPLGVRFLASSTEAEVAARVMMGSNPLGLRIIEEGLPVDPDTPSLVRGSKTFELWLPCDDCDGVLLPLSSSSDGELVDAATEALECLGWVEADGCPQCRTRRARAGDTEDGPLRIWYDTALNDWMLRLPDASGESLVLALRLRRFSAQQQEVQAAVDAIIEREHRR